jgi:hypothetical protein
VIQTIKRIILSSALLSLLVLPVAALGTVSAQSLNCTGSIADCLDDGAESTDQGTGEEAATQVDRIIKRVVDIFSVVVGVVAVIMIIIGGLKYITSGGDSGNISSAKNTILYAIIGLIVVVLAQVVVRFVLQRAAE